jgi:hypothetical protein
MEIKARDVYFLLVFLVFFILAVALPYYGPSDDTTKTIFGAATFFFSIFTGFSIAKLNGRQSSIKASSMNESSALVSLYHLSHAFSKKASDEINSKIDSYLVKVLILPYTLYYLADSEFNNLFSVINQLETKTKKQSELFSAICYELRQISDARSFLNVEFLSGLSKRIKFLQYTLGAFLTVLVYVMKEPNPLSILITTIFPSAIVLVFMYLHELETFK